MRLAVACRILFLFAATSMGLAQVQTATLAGTVTDPSGAAVADAKVTAKNSQTGGSAQVQSDSYGKFEIPNLALGEYEVSVTAAGFETKATRVTLGAGGPQSIQISLATLPSAPSLSDLGFPTAETKGSAEEQARLDQRSHMLKIHQRMGLITAAPLLATVITGGMAKGHRDRTTGAFVSSPDTTGRNVHMGLGITTTALYFTTAYFAIRAPKVEDTKTRGPIRLHKTLAWVHGTGMVLTPILGAMAYQQLNRGERVHGIASAHAPVAYATAIAYGAAILSVSLKW